MRQQTHENKQTPVEKERVFFEFFSFFPPTQILCASFFFFLSTKGLLKHHPRERERERERERKDDDDADFVNPADFKNDDYSDDDEKNERGWWSSK